MFGAVLPEEMTGQPAVTPVTYVPATWAPMVLYETVTAPLPLKVEPEAAPEPVLLKVTALATEPEEPVMLAFMEVVLI